MRPRGRVLPEECSFGVSPNQEAKCRASWKWLTSPEVAATIGVAVSKPTPGIDNNVVQAGDCRTPANPALTDSVNDV